MITAAVVRFIPIRGVGCNFLGLQFVALLFVHPHTGVWVVMILLLKVLPLLKVHPHTGRGF